jgi:hypothetical protein
MLSLFVTRRLLNGASYIELNYKAGSKYCGVGEHGNTKAAFRQHRFLTPIIINYANIS